MALTERFINDVQLGDQISLVVGPKEIIGIVDFIDSSTVQVKRDNGFISTISIDSISYYEISALSKERNTKDSNPYIGTNDKSSGSYRRNDFRAFKKFTFNPKKTLASYIEAIKNNYNHVEATIELVEYCLFKYKQCDAAKYLVQYGFQYMTEDYFNTYKNHLIEKYENFEYKILDYENREKLKGEQVTNYYELAQEANKNKDLQQCINYYKEAIDQKQMMVSVVPNLVQVYTRLQMYDDALELLDEYGEKYMDKKNYLNLRISVLGAAKDKKYEQDIRNTYRDIIFITKNIEKITDYQLASANLLNEIGCYEQSIQYYIKILDKIESEVYTDKRKSMQTKMAALTGLYNAYSSLNNTEKMDGLLGKIKELEHVIQNEYSSSSSENDILSAQPIHEIETVGEASISGYIVRLIDQIDLENEIRNKTLLQNGVFSGTIEDAKTIIQSITYNQVGKSVNNEIQSNYYFSIAKIIRQILDRKEEITLPNIFSEGNYKTQVAIGCLFYGNYQLYRTGTVPTFDTARYCYLESISIFKDIDNIHKCWAAATIRYIQTLYYSVADMKVNYGRFGKNDTYERSYKSILQKIFRREPTIPIDLYTASMIEMLAFNPKAKSLVLTSIYSDDLLFKKVITELEKICGKTLGENEISEHSFTNLWNETTIVFFNNRNTMLQQIEETINSAFTIGHLRECYTKLNENSFSDYFSPTDKMFYGELKLIITKLIRYNEISEFDYKAETLNEVESTRKRLIDNIIDHPTYIGFEKFIPILSRLGEEIFEESRQLYGDSQPEITAELSGNCSIDETEYIVRVPIAFRNKKNVQNADNVSIRIEGENLDVTNDEQLSRGLLVGNGNAQEELFEFKVTPAIIAEGVISAAINIQYQYKTSMVDAQEGNIEIPLSIPLHANSVFEPIKNRFEPYRNGAEVKDISMFYGRDNDIENIIQQISDENGNVLRGRCLALYGQTRTGKSSLLYHLERRLREIDEKRNVIINIGSIGEENLTGNDISEFLYTIIDELKNEIDSKHPDLKDILLNYEIDINPDEILDNYEHAELYFNKVFRDINRCIEKEKLNYNIIILIDEFTYIYDWIRQGTMTDRIMKFWKAFIQNNNIFAVIIGQDHMMKFIEDRQFTNDFGSTDTRKVTYLPVEDAKKLMYEPIMLINEKGEKVNRYKEGALDRLCELTAGSAFLIMNLCAGLVDYLNGIQSDFITKAHIEDYLKKNLRYFEEARYFEPQYADKSNIFNDETNDANKRILRRIAQLSNKKEWTPLSSIIKTEEDRRLIDALEKRDVLIISNNDRCKIKVALYKEWLIERYGLEGKYE